MPRALQRWVSAFDLDRAVGLSLLNPVRGLVLAPLTAAAVAIAFTPEAQGYYYTFNSLVAFLALAEVGIGAVVVQFASHEWASLGRGPDGAPAGDPAALRRLRGLARSTLASFALLGLALGAAVGVAGAGFIGGTGSPGIAWLLPWLALCLATAAHLALVPLWALLEGCGRVEEVAAFRLLRGVLYTSVLVAALLLGAGLWSAAVAWAAAVAMGVAAAASRFRPTFRTLLGAGPREAPPRRWLGLQWRMMAGWAGTTLVFSFLVPVAFALVGPVAAGRLGMSVSLLLVLTGLSSAWVGAKAPALGALVARQDRAGLEGRFARLLVGSLGLAGIGAGLMLLGVVLLQAISHPLAERVLPPLELGLLLAAGLLAQATVPFGAYLRAHKAEPLALPSVLTVLAMVAAAAWAAPTLGTLGMTAAALLVALAVGLPWHAATWLGFRRASALAGARPEPPPVPPPVSTHR